MAKYNFKFGIFSSKNGKVHDKEVFDESGKQYPGYKFTGDLKNGIIEGYGELTQGETGTYAGEWRNGQFNGHGIYNWRSGSRYEGDWKNDKRNGQGKMTWHSGQKYEGEWNDSKRHGKGAYTYKDGTKYVGDFKNDSFCGKGTKTWTDGRKYEGDWKDDLLNGYGKQTEEGCIREGHFIDEKQNGQGTMCDVFGHKYIGNFKNDKFHGQGTYETNKNDEKRWNFKAEDVYVGEWVEHEPIGKCTLTHADGTCEIGTYYIDRFDGRIIVVSDIKNWDFATSTGKGKEIGSYSRCVDGEWRIDNDFEYNGDFKDGKWCGKGTRIIIDGEKYEGDWKAGMQHGKGTQTWPEGHKYEGDWKDGYMHGKGTLTFTNGNKYEGDWNDHKKHGKGIHTWLVDSQISSAKAGDIYEGDWKDDIRTGQGIMSYSNGDVYTGKWLDNETHGIGALRNSKGEIIADGFWVKGECVSLEIKKFVDQKNYSSAIKELENLLELDEFASNKEIITISIEKFKQKEINKTLASFGIDQKNNENDFDDFN